MTGWDIPGYPGYTIPVIKQIIPLIPPHSLSQSLNKLMVIRPSKSLCDTTLTKSSNVMNMVSELVSSNTCSTCHGIAEH